MYVRYKTGIGSYIQGMQINGLGDVVPQSPSSNSTQEYLYLTSTQRITQINFVVKKGYCSPTSFSNFAYCYYITQVYFGLNDGTGKSFPQSPISCGSTCDYSFSSGSQSIKIDPCLYELRGIRAYTPTSTQLKADTYGIESFYYYLAKPTNPYCSGKFTNSATTTASTSTSVSIPTSTSPST